MSNTREWLARLVDATNAHDLDRLVGCFAVDYENTSPAHPSRGFTGREQVRRNWEQIFAAVPDLRADVVAESIDGGRAWTEWDMRGTRPDGSAHHMAGVIVFDIADGLAGQARFFLEPVDASQRSVDDAIRDQVGR